MKHTGKDKYKGKSGLSYHYINNKKTTYFSRKIKIKLGIVDVQY